jgi:hypothetical protein
MLTVPSVVCAAWAGGAGSAGGAGWGACGVIGAAVTAGAGTASGGLVELQPADATKATANAKRVMHMNRDSVGLFERLGGCGRSAEGWKLAATVAQI